MWDAVANTMQWDKVKNYDSLIDEIRKGILFVPKNDLVHSVKNLSDRILSILQAKRFIYKISFSL